MDDETAYPAGPAGAVCLPRPNPLGIVALSGVAWLVLGVALARAGLSPLWAAGLGYLLSPVPVLALLVARQAGRRGEGRGAPRADGIADWEADRAHDGAVTAATARDGASRTPARRRVA